MILYVFDERCPISRPATTHRRGTIVDSFVVRQTDTIQNVVETIVQHARTERNIWMLRICGHGYPGQVQLGRGLDITTSCWFLEAAGYFTPGGPGIELHSCLVASARLPAASCGQEYLNAVNSGTPISQQCLQGTPGAYGTGRPRPNRRMGIGFAFMQSLADAAQAPVTAAYDVQGADAEFRWEGRGTMTAHPQMRDLSCSSATP